MKSRRTLSRFAVTPATPTTEVLHRIHRPDDSGDIVRLTNGIFSFSHYNNLNLVLGAGKKGKIEKAVISASMP
ncbi:hypothetical protein Pint_11429 [Pistacia integerrima]|uniref:Uncharacterized protein n=1 Tax=Pistacia integerrima TaxID=434235 RepID=A0ACC0XHX0_9ROSI|nr:hypothetical protein Pint_11429 [Pistacia integerrima]